MPQLLLDEYLVMFTAPPYSEQSAAAGELHEAGSQAEASVFQLPDVIQQGERNTVLFKYGCQLRAAGRDKEEISVLLHYQNDTRCEIPVEQQDMTEAEEEIASALSLPDLLTANTQKRMIEQPMAALYAGEIKIPSGVVDEILRTGSNHARSQLRIIYNYMIDQPSEDYTDFVRREYGKGGKGFVIDGRDYSVWFDELGMQIAVGYTVEDKILDKAFLSWDDVSGRIQQLLNQGEYAPQVVLDAARENALHVSNESEVETPAETKPKLREIVIDLTSRDKEPEHKQEPINFRITDDDLGAGGPKAKFRANMDAIYLLKKLENEGRLANPEEQEVLSRFVGWGGISKAFDAESREWSGEFAEVKAALTPEEYREARASTLNAFYTSPTVIKAMYEALGNFGLTSGNVLEPSCGIGNFMGLVPESMNDLRMYGVELDSISGRIAKQLYQKNQIAVQGFETTEFPDSFFDCVVGNVPFGQYKVSDRKYDRYNFLIHDYFIARSLDLTRPGGVVAVVTSAGTMDKQNESVRQYLANRADLIGAIRLPDNAFMRNANTGVVADILFFQKRDRAALTEPEWVHLGTTPEGYRINEYFVQHPEMVLGEFSTENTQYGKQEVTVKPIEGANLASLSQQSPPFQLLFYRISRLLNRVLFLLAFFPSSF